MGSCTRFHLSSGNSALHGHRNADVHPFRPLSAVFGADSCMQAALPLLAACSAPLSTSALLMLRYEQGGRSSYSSAPASLPTQIPACLCSFPPQSRRGCLALRTCVAASPSTAPRRT